MRHFWETMPLRAEEPRQLAPHGHPPTRPLHGDVRQLGQTRGGGGAQGARHGLVTEKKNDGTEEIHENYSNVDGATAGV